MTFSEESPELGKSESLVLSFNASVDPASLVLSGDLAAEATGTWSTTHNENDTYTLKPSAGTWMRGSKEIAVSATGAKGGSISGASANYIVKLEFAKFAAADTVIGQPDFSSNAPARQATGLSDPYGSVAIAADGKLFVADYSHRRVLGYNALPTANGAAASIVLGQPDFTSAVVSPAPVRSEIDGPQQVSIAGGKMAVTDYSWNRVLIYNSIPTGSAALPDVVVGQTDFTQMNAACGAADLARPESSFLTPDGKLIVADRENNRVLIWNQIPATHGKPADLVIGQGRFDQCIGNDDNQDGIADVTASRRTLWRPSAIWSDGERLVVADSNNNRVLIWNTFPSRSFQPADLVIGQASFDKGASNDDDQDGFTDLINQSTGRTLDTPYNVASNGVQLAVVDLLNNRVLIWNAFPTSNFQPADTVLGQGTFNRNAYNDDDQNGVQDATPSARTLAMPLGAFFHDDKLLITDTVNNRILVFTSK